MLAKRRFENGSQWRLPLVVGGARLVAVRRSQPPSLRSVHTAGVYRTRPSETTAGLGPRWCHNIESGRPPNIPVPPVNAVAPTLTRSPSGVTRNMSDGQWCSLSILPGSTGTGGAPVPAKWVAVERV